MKQQQTAIIELPGTTIEMRQVTMSSEVTAIPLTDGTGSLDFEIAKKWLSTKPLRRREQPRIVPDTDVHFSVDEMAKFFCKLGTPVEEDTPLSIDPDDYPVH